MSAQNDRPVALVTGASRGLGAAIATRLARVGHDVALVARDRSALEAVAEDAAAFGARTLVVAVDLRDPQAPAEVVERAQATWGRLDVLVNNAGATKRGDFFTLGDEDFIDGFALKFHATVRFCRAAWPLLEAAQGSIVNIIGVGARTPAPDFTIGGSVNSALTNFTKALATRAQGSGIRINAINPGHIETDRLTRRIEAFAAQEGLSLDAARERMRQASGIARFGEPQDIAAAVAFLCSPDAAYIHGATLDVDGGVTRGI